MDSTNHPVRNSTFPACSSDSMTQKVTKSKMELTGPKTAMNWAAGIANGDVILAVLARQRQPPAPPSIITPDALRLKIEPTADCGRYDTIRKVA